MDSDIQIWIVSLIVAVILPIILIKIMFRGLAATLTIFSISLVSFVVTYFMFKPDLYMSFFTNKAWLEQLLIKNLPEEFIKNWSGIRYIVSIYSSILTEWVLCGILIFSLPKQTEIIKRGVVIHKDRDLVRSISKKEKNLKSCLKLGVIPIPVEKETRHILLAGSPGTGKTTLIKENLNIIRARNQRAIILDANGDLMSQMYKDGDSIISIDDERSVNWSILSEIRDRNDCPSLAASLVPDGVGESKPWHQYAQVICSTVLEKLFESGNATNKYLYKYLALDNQSKLAKLVEGTEATRLFAEGNERMLGSVLSIVSSYLRPFRLLDPNAGANAWSLRHWITDETQNSWLWIPYNTDTEEATRTFRGTLIDIIMRVTCSLPPSSVRRNWLILDELMSAGNLSRLPDAAARGRKHGLAMFLGFQSVCQLREIYGRDQTETILSCAGNKVVRTEDPDTASYLSRMIGDQEVEREQKSHSHQNVSIFDDSHGTRPNHTVQKVREVKHAILESEIMEFQDLYGLAKLSGYGWAHINIKHPKKQSIVVPPHIPKVHINETLTPQESGKVNLYEETINVNNDELDINCNKKIKFK